MRTTIDIEDDLMAVAKEIARQEKVNELRAAEGI